MSELAPQAELLRTLSRLVRGLSALFWGLPLALVVSVQTAKTNLLGGMGILPPLLAHGLLLYGLSQIGEFQRGERVWRLAVHRSMVIAIVNLGLAPFLYWWKMMPQVLHFQIAILVLALGGLLLLLTLNQALIRLAAMLPDETLRLEARLFTTLNQYLLVATLILVALWVLLRQQTEMPPWFLTLWLLVHQVGLLVLLLLVLLPMALTMALLWKIKETILNSVFSR